MATKATLLANILSKVKAKVGLIDKVELGNVHEDIVNEVYRDFIVANTLNQLVFSKQNTGFDFTLYVKKVGNTVHFSGTVFHDGTVQGAVYPSILILNSEYEAFSNGVDEFIFNFQSSRAGFAASAYIKEDRFYFRDYVISGQGINFSGTYNTLNP